MMRLMRVAVGLVGVLMRLVRVAVRLVSVVMRFVGMAVSVRVTVPMPMTVSQLSPRPATPK